MSTGARIRPHVADYRDAVFAPSGYTAALRRPNPTPCPPSFERPISSKLCRTPVHTPLSLNRTNYNCRIRSAGVSELPTRHGWSMLVQIGSLLPSPSPDRRFGDITAYGSAVKAFLTPQHCASVPDIDLSNAVTHPATVRAISAYYCLSDKSPENLHW
jgi:hypothetical protein